MSSSSEDDYDRQEECDKRIRAQTKLYIRKCRAALCPGLTAETLVELAKEKTQLEKKTGEIDFTLLDEMAEGQVLKFMSADEICKLLDVCTTPCISSLFESNHPDVFYNYVARGMCFEPAEKRVSVYDKIGLMRMLLAAIQHLDHRRVAPTKKNIDALLAIANA